MIILYRKEWKGDFLLDNALFNRVSEAVALKNQLWNLNSFVCNVIRLTSCYVIDFDKIYAALIRIKRSVTSKWMKSVQVCFFYPLCVR
jgi:hypothetical protein